MKNRYLRGRPFLILNTLHRPSPEAATHIKGWGEKEGSWQSGDQLLFADHISDRTMRTASVIIDLLPPNTGFVKLRHATDHREELLAYYLGKYKEQIKHAISIWMDKKSHAMAKDMLRQEQLKADSDGNLSVDK